MEYAAHDRDADRHAAVRAEDHQLARQEGRPVLGRRIANLVPKAFADAAAALMLAQGKKPVPYHGYYFHILKAQGPDAEGGAMDYVVKGKMIGGFALIAWPAEYGVSGVKTFIVNHHGRGLLEGSGPPPQRPLARQAAASIRTKRWKKEETE